MLEKLIIALSSIAVGFVCISGINAVSSKVNEKSNLPLSEQAYINNDTLSAENLPYYQKETTEELVTVFVDSNNNSLIHELKD